MPDLADTVACLRRAAEIVQWSVDVPPTVSPEMLAEAREIKAALRRAADALTWIPVAEKLPDDDLTVMIACKDADEPVWLGWHDESGWCSIDATPMRDCVTHWKPMPEGPNG